ncbi:hypothetical protein [Limnohabitans sp. 63ED37-2]|uniref:hypothetical protein n=1 Tax=Limnohabitans sp. 63ED37-2 TaxID=1678128 RepID=UPI000705EFE3|nr:hypothetical protein [Limnohabitans sp. 63ED37-2]ALK90263.1 hypothetical protein L63ED372_03065 [Limnohabitans sp. 63ED37-2]
MTDTPKLTSSDKRDLIIQAGMQLVPYVGGSLTSLYFGAKQEKRFKRLESFYQEIASEIEKMKGSISSVDKQDPIALEAIIESLHEKIEVEPTLEKREFFKNYFKNTLKFPVAGNFDERKYFLDALYEMTLLECELLAFIDSQPNSIQVGNIQKPGTNKYAVVGAIGRLKSRGFLTATQGSFAVGGGADNSLQEIVSVSSFGKSFITFCLHA